MKLFSLQKLSTSILTVGLLLSSEVFSQDLVIASTDAYQTELKKTLSYRTNREWKVSDFEGTQLDLVDDIRLKAVKSQLPSAALIPGATIRRWAALGFLKELDAVSIPEQWKARLPKQIYDSIIFQEKTYAVPTQVHRSNWMWMNRDVLNRSRDTAFTPPKTWSRFLALIDSNSTSTPWVVTVDTPEQNTIVFESLLLGLGGPEVYQQVFQEFDYKTLRSDKMIEIFHHFSRLRPLLTAPQYASWNEAAAALKKGQGAVLFAGDWVKPVFNNDDGRIAEHILCEPYPEAPATFLYNLNSVVMFKDTQRHAAETLADVMFTETLLTDINLQEGSIPARLDISPYGFDRCGIRSMREFRSAHSINTLNPSLAAGMAAPEPVQKQVYDAINRFVNDAAMSPEEGAKELAKAIRVALYKI